MLRGIGLKKAWTLLGLAGLGILAVRWFPPARPPYLGVRNGQLPACPASPNCVCSQATDADHAVAPLPFNGSPDQAFEAVQRAVEQLARTHVVRLDAAGRYLHAECRTRLFAFVDDLEVFVDAGSRQIHFRSASRLGYSDLGVNRGRVEQLKAAIGKELPRA